MSWHIQDLFAFPFASYDLRRDISLHLGLFRHNDPLPPFGDRLIRDLSEVPVGPSGTLDSFSLGEPVNPLSGLSSGLFPVYGPTVGVKLVEIQVCIQNVLAIQLVARSIEGELRALDGVSHS